MLKLLFFSKTKSSKNNFAQRRSDSTLRRRAVARNSFLANPNTGENKESST
jgi:hypothetical protein